MAADRIPPWNYIEPQRLPFLISKHISHDHPSPSPSPSPPLLTPAAPELCRKRKDTCKVAARLCAVASLLRGKKDWKVSKRIRTESSEGWDSPKATCLHGRTVKGVLRQDHSGGTHRIDARLADWKSNIRSPSRRCEGRILSGIDIRTECVWRFMYFERGDWVGYPDEANRVAWESLKAGCSMVEINSQNRFYRLNFVEMMQVNIKTGYMRSIAWVDDAGEVSFPPNPFAGPSLQSSVEHPGTHGPGTWVNQHRASWRDGATDSMAHCLLSSDVAQVCDIHCTEAGVALDGDWARDAIHTQCETQHVPVPVFSIDGSSSCTLRSDQPDCNRTLRFLKEQTGSPAHTPDYPSLGNKFVALKDGDQEFEDVKSRFIGGLAISESDKLVDTLVTGIYRDASSTAKARQQAFELQQIATEKTRGNANVRYAWHGTSKMGVTGIFVHGFGQPRTPKNGSAYGVGVYLAPEKRSFFSALYADDDENGVQHVVLCKVIVGAAELVKPGSEQFHPSSEQFDTGVDDLLAPKRLIVWSTHMNTHILPLYVVSFKLPCRWRKRLAELQGKNRGVSSLCQEVFMKLSCSAKQTQQMSEALGDELKGCSLRQQGLNPSFPDLFALLRPFMAPAKILLLKKCLLAYKAGKFPRGKLNQMFRDIVGEKRLLHAIKFLQGCQVNKEEELINYESPISVSGMNLNLASPLLHV